MYKNYLLIALRTFWRNKIFSVINVLGLAIGISAALVIYLIVSYDLGFDKFEKGAEKIYRVVSDMKFPDGDFKNAGVPLPLVPAAQKELTGVETFVPVKVANRIKVAIAVAGVQAPEVYKSQTKIIYTNNNTGTLHVKRAANWAGRSIYRHDAATGRFVWYCTHHHFFIKAKCYALEQPCQ